MTEEKLGLVNASLGGREKMGSRAKGAAADEGVAETESSRTVRAVARGCMVRGDGGGHGETDNLRFIISFQKNQEGEAI
jgi:hypothetical protein